MITFLSLIPCEDKFFFLFQIFFVTLHFENGKQLLWYKTNKIENI